MASARERNLTEVGTALDVVDDDLDAGVGHLRLDELLLDLTQTVAAGRADPQRQHAVLGVLVDAITVLGVAGRLDRRLCGLDVAHAITGIAGVVLVGALVRQPVCVAETLGGQRRRTAACRGPPSPRPCPSRRRVPSRTAGLLRCMLWRFRPQCSNTGPAELATVKSSLEARSSKASCGWVKMICASPASGIDLRIGVGDQVDLHAVDRGDLTLHG